MIPERNKVSRKSQKVKVSEKNRKFYKRKDNFDDFNENYALYGKGGNKEKYRR